MQILKKLKSIFLGALGGALFVTMLLGASYASALLTPGTGGGDLLTPKGLCQFTSGTWAFCNSADVMGDSTNPLANGEFTSLTIGTATISGTVSGNLNITDDNMLQLGTTDDIVLLNRSTSLSADTELTSVIVGAVGSDHQGVAANSLILSNITTDGDIMMLVSDNGDSKEFLLANGDTANLQIGHGMTTVNIKTASGAITLTPTTDTLLTNGTGMVVGHTAQVATAGITNPELEVLGTTDSDASLALLNFSAGGGSGSLVIGHSRNATIGSFTIVEDNDTLGTIAFTASDNSDINTTPVRIRGEVDDANPAASDIGGALTFSTASGTGTDDLREIMRINAAGQVIPASNDFAPLGIAGTAWSDLFLAEGGVINWDSSDVTLTQAGNVLTFAGGDFHTADATGIVIGHTAQISPAGVTPELQVLGTSQGDDTAMVIGGFNNQIPFLFFTKSRGATVGGSGAVQDGDSLGNIDWRADDGTDFVTSSASMVAEVRGTVATNRIPSVIRFNVSPGTADNDAREQLRIDGTTGTLSIGDADRSTTAQLNGIVRSADMIAGTTTNAAGTDLTISGGLGTGTGDAGTIIFSLPETVASGTNVHTRASAMTFDMVASTTVATMTLNVNWIVSGTWDDLGIATTIDLNGGTIDGTTIGASSVANGSFSAIVGTTITGSGILSIDDTTDSTSGTSGSIHTDGGLGVLLDLFVGNDILVADTGVIGITGNEILTFNAAGNIQVGGARFQTRQGADVASTTNLVLPADGNVFELTGTTKVDLISNLTWQEGSVITLICNESVTIDDGTATSSTNITLVLAGGADFSCTAEDVITFVLSSTTATGQAWREISRSAN